MSRGAASGEPAGETLGAILAGLDKPASYLAAARRLAALGEHGARPGLQPVRVFVLASFTFELVLPYLAVEGARRGLDLAAGVGAYGQLEQQALDPASALYASGAEIVVLAARVEDAAPELADGFVALAPAAVDAAIDAYVARLAGVCRAIRERSPARVLVWNQPPLRRLAAGLADPALEPSQQGAIGELNRRLARACAAIPGAVVFDAARLGAELGARQWFDDKLAVLARAPLSGAAQLAVGRHLARTLRAMLRPPCKCLVLDLDNTLWGGVLGEDGIAGIALGEDYPGSVYKRFQRVLRGYRDRGVLLAIASKNNEADVAELFATHKELVLSRADFAAAQVHWNDKAGSLRAIAAELEIGVDSLAFFDDNPVERAWVREQLPEVTVIDVPAEPLRYIDALDESGAFDHLVVTAEDRVRAAQYQSEQGRKELARAAGSLDEFLAALQMKVTIGRIDAATLPRVAQLLGKTNQFNVTTRRHTEGDLAAMLGRGAIGLWMRVADRYGDSGLVGVGLAVREDAGADAGCYRLDSFLMSCRVLGRKAEHALLGAIARRARDGGASVLLGEFIPTKKNAPAAGFFADTGFAPIEGRPGWWRLDLAQLAEGPRLFEVIFEGEGAV
jgi:FkbH-like protein